MVDMSAFIAAKSDQLNADDLMDAPRTITITKVTAQPDAAEQPVSIHYEGGEGRPWKPCKTMRRILVGVWGKDASRYIGRALTLYRDPTVAFGGLQVGGIRISHMSDISEDKTVALLVTRGRKAPFKIKPLVDPPHRSQPSDFSGQLAELQAIAKPGNMDALGAKWQEIGPEARKALGAELPALKAACEESPGESTDDEERRHNGGYTADESDGTPPPEEQSGEVNDAADEPTAAEIAVAQTIAALGAETDAKKLEKLIAEAEKHRPFLPDDLLIKLEKAYSDNRNRLEAKVGEPVK